MTLILKKHIQSVVVLLLKFYNNFVGRSQAIISMSRSNHRVGGRIRVTDDSAVTIGAGVEVRAEHVAAVNATKI